MPQIAQQDYIKFPVSSIDFTLTSEEKAQLKEYARAGVLFDVILITPTNSYAKILQYQITDELFNLTIANETELKFIEE